MSLAAAHAHIDSLFTLEPFRFHGRLIFAVIYVTPALRVDRSHTIQPGILSNAGYQSLQQIIFIYSPLFKKKASYYFHFFHTIRIIGTATRP